MKSIDFSNLQSKDFCNVSVSNQPIQLSSMQKESILQLGRQPLFKKTLFIILILHIGLISCHGHYPSSIDKKFQDYMTVGPLTRYAEDLKLMTKVLSEPGRIDFEEEVCEIL